MNSCASKTKKEETEIRYEIPEIYFPEVPLIHFNFNEETQNYELDETDLFLLMKYIKETEEGVEAYYSLFQPRNEEN